MKLHPKGGGKRGERRGERGEEDRNENQLIEEGDTIKKKKMWRGPYLYSDDNVNVKV